MAKKKRTKREPITLECQNERDGKKCSERTYKTEKNRMNTPDRLELRKYCPRCDKPGVQKEVK